MKCAELKVVPSTQNAKFSIVLASAAVVLGTKQYASRILDTANCSFLIDVGIISSSIINKS